MTGLVLLLAGLLAAMMVLEAAEIAVTMASRVRLRTRAEHGWRGARVAERLLAHPERAIITCLVGNTLVSVALGAYARGLVMRAWPVSEAVADLVATLATVPLVLVLGQTLPKALAQTIPNRTLAALAPGLEVLRWALWPLTRVSLLIAGFFRWLVRLEPELLDFLSREELKQFVAMSERRGHVDSDERDLIYRIFEFWRHDPQRFVRPLGDVPRLPIDAPVVRARQMVREKRLSRLVVTDPLDRDVVGVVSAVTLLGAPPDARLADVAHPPVRSELAQGIDRLLASLQRSPSQIAVVPHHGGVGVLLLDDLLSALLGGVEPAARGARSAAGGAPAPLGAQTP